MKKHRKISQENILFQLQKIGLGETDALIYLTSIQQGASSLRQLVTQTKLNRTTAHDSIGRLVKKGLLLETFSGRKRLLFPAQLDTLQRLVDVKKNEVDKLQQNVSSTIHLLKSLHLQSQYLPTISIVKGSKGIQTIIKDIEHSTGTVQIISDSRHFDELLSGEFLDILSKQKKSLDIIIPNGFEHFIFSAQAKGLQTQTRELQDPSRSGGLMIREDKVSFHAYEGVYVTSTIIHNKAISHMMTSSFQSMRQT